MLTTLLAAGIFDTGNLAGTGALIAAPEAIVAIPRVAASTAGGAGIPLGAPVWALPLDPSDQVPFAWDFTALLDDGATIAAVEALTMSAAGAAVGVQIATAAPCGPIVSTDGLKVQVWFLVDPTDAAAPAFTGTGLQVAVAAMVRTSESPPRVFERSAVLVVRHL